jgi:uncharacterized protein (DUF488 family)
MEEHLNAAPAIGLDLYTIGHSTRRIDEFLALLQAHGIQQLVDVRTAAGSRRNPQFMKNELSRTLAAHAIRYTHIPTLGGFRKPRADSPNAAWRNASFRGYADYMQTPEFERALAELLDLAARAPTAVMCAESVPWRCHRSLIADAVVARGLTAGHITSPYRCNAHMLTSFARVESGRVTYPEKAENASD